MLLGKNWKIESDELNVILYRHRTRKSRTGETYEDWDIAGYYATVPNALRALVDFGVKETGLKDLETVVAKIEELYKLISLSPLDTGSGAMGVSITPPINRRDK